MLAQNPERYLKISSSRPDSHFYSSSRLPMAVGFLARSGTEQDYAHLVTISPEVVSRSDVLVWVFDTFL